MTMFAVAIDLDQDAQLVLETAKQLSSACVAELVLIYVVDSMGRRGSRGDALSLGPDVRVRVEAQLRKSIGELVGQVGFEQEPRVMVSFGLPHKLVTQSARDVMPIFS